MADLDLLRDINNTYGHLAGDAVLKGIAEIFRAQLRHYDVPARFGGEEFAILLPETPPEQALEIAERIRRAVAASAFEVETSSEPIRATVSIGVAGFPRDCGRRERARSTRPTSPSTARSFRAGTASSTRAPSRSSFRQTRAAPLVAVPDDGEQSAPLPAGRRTRISLRSGATAATRVHGPRSSPCRNAWRLSSASWGSWAQRRASPGSSSVAATTRAG